MNEDEKNSDDLLDHGISKILQKLGAIFPKTVADFAQLELDEKSFGATPPTSIEDPYAFLNETRFKRHLDLKVIKIGQGQGYSQNFAQAAREGKNISLDVKNKMAQDKIKSSQNKNSGD